MSTLDDAIAEAYASAPQDIIILHTLEINHKSFGVPVRVVRWPVHGPEPETFSCLLESTAPKNAGQTVSFTAMPFDIKLPEKSQETPGQFTITLAGVGDMLDDALETAAIGGGIVTAIYRTFIKGRQGEGPAEVYPGIELQSPELDSSTGTITVTGVVLNWINRPFGRLYTPSRYPGLVS